MNAMIKKHLRFGLFWKILLGFWAVFIVIFTFNLFFTHLSSDAVRYRKLPEHLQHQLVKIKKRLHHSLKRMSGRKLKSTKHYRNIYLIDGQGEDLLGKKVPSIILQLHKLSQKNGNAMTAFQKQSLSFGGSGFDYKNETYKIYKTQRFSVLSRGYFGVFIREFSHNLLVSMFLISFPLSFLIAWFFSRPIKRLQMAVSELSNNLSERKSLDLLTSRQDEFGDLARDFDAMAMHLEKILLSKTRLLSDVSHELRSPLARLQIALGLAHKKRNVHESKSTQINIELDRIKLEADRMNQMLSGLLDYSKMDNTYSKHEEKSIDLSQLLKQLITDAEFEGDQKGITIESIIQPHTFIIGDQLLLMSCFDNILRNGIRYANSKIIVECKTFQSLESSKEFIQVSIQDDGDGIGDDQKEKIFEAFYRPETDRSRQSGGVGLGLSIAKKAIEAHCGEIFAENINPSGLKIMIKLPSENSVSANSISN